MENKTHVCTGSPACWDPCGGQKQGKWLIRWWASQSDNMMPRYAAYQTNSLQTEQKVGWGKNVALNSWHLTTWILACLMAPRRWCRANRPSLSRSDSGPPSGCPAASKTYRRALVQTEKRISRGVEPSLLSVCEWLREVQEEAPQVVPVV